jgi:hypothetical protein
MRWDILLTQFILTVYFFVVILANLAVLQHAYTRCGCPSPMKGSGSLHLVISFDILCSVFVIQMPDCTCCSVKVVHKAKSWACAQAIWSTFEQTGTGFVLILCISPKIDNEPWTRWSSKFDENKPEVFNCRYLGKVLIVEIELILRFFFVFSFIIIIIYLS